jgi:hypothetical protein
MQELEIKPDFPTGHAAAETSQMTVSMQESESTSVAVIEYGPSPARLWRCGILRIATNLLDAQLVK